MAFRPFSPSEKFNLEVLIYQIICQTRDSGALQPDTTKTDDDLISYYVHRFGCGKTVREDMDLVRKSLGDEEREVEE